MNTNMFKHVIQIQEKDTVDGALGPKESWHPVVAIRGLHESVDVRTVAEYQKLNTVVTDKFILPRDVDVQIGKHRLLYAGNYYYPSVSAEHLENNTVVITYAS